jgi:hypothetical protein
MLVLAARHGRMAPVSRYSSACFNRLQDLTATVVQYVFFVDVENTLEIWWKDSNSSHETPNHPTNLWVNSKSHPYKPLPQSPTLLLKIRTFPN